MFIWVIVALVVAFVGFALYVRVAPDDVARWHVDPVTATERGKQNDYIVSPTGAGVDMASPVFAMTPEALMQRFDAVAIAAPGVTKLSDVDGYVTYVQRSKLMAFPDYMSVRAVAVEGGAALHIYSRARYGQRDFDVNKNRVLAWLGQI